MKEEKPEEEKENPYSQIFDKDRYIFPKKIEGKPFQILRQREDWIKKID